MKLKAVVLLSGRTATGIEGLSHSRRQRFTLAIEQAKAPETRQRRVDKAINDLRAGRA
ncbi:MAG: YdeI/OmpD-associated family protein [Candidatus Dormiibacterota bacterium]